MTITKITTHSADAIAGMLSQFSDSPRLQELITICVDEVQLAEDVGWDVHDKSTLANAVGAILEEYGDLLQELRGSLSDDEYRAALETIVAAYQSDGTAPEVIYLASEVIGVAVRYIQYTPAHYRLEYVIDTHTAGDWRARIAKIIEICRPAGVSNSLIEGDDNKAFQFDSGPGFDDGMLADRIV